MNDYVRQAHPGQAVTAFGNAPGTYNPSFLTGANPDFMDSPAEGRAQFVAGAVGTTPERVPGPGRAVRRSMRRLP